MAILFHASDMTAITQSSANKRSRAPGAGVKTDDGAKPLARKQVLLDEATERIALMIGNGNLSLGLREAVRRAHDHNDLLPFDAGRHRTRKSS